VKGHPSKPGETGFYFGLAHIGMEMVAPLVVGVFLDLRFGWLPWGTIVGFVLGFVGGFVHLLAMLKQQEARERSDSSGES
jgi:F0F1-type ATP synthase assembly protein I